MLKTITAITILVFFSGCLRLGKAKNFQLNINNKLNRSPSGKSNVKFVCPEVPMFCYDSGWYFTPSTKIRIQIPGFASYTCWYNGPGLGTGPGLVEGIFGIQANTRIKAEEWIRVECSEREDCRKLFCYQADE